jgi:hypothetical protein
MDIRQQIKERAKAHFASRSVGKVEVPEWDCAIFYKTPNLATLKAVMAEAQGDAIEAQARIVVACATDDAGERIWSKPEYRDLMTSVDPGIVARIANAILAEANLDMNAKQAAEDEKN